jgi:hypothetical protein
VTLLQVQGELKAPKNQHNNFGGYDYRSAEDILTAAKPLLAKYGDGLILSDEPIMVGDWHYIKATATFTAKDGKVTTVTGFAREAANKKGMDDSQITGTASSYARKYALNGLFLIDDTKDADTNEYRQQQRQTRQRQSQRKAPAKPSQLELDRKEYAELRAKIIAASGNKFTPKQMNDQLTQMARVNSKDSASAKASKLVAAAREVLKQYQGGKQQ